MLKRQLLCFLRNRVRHRWTEDHVAPVQVVAAGTLPGGGTIHDRICQTLRHLQAGHPAAPRSDATQGHPDSRRQTRASSIFLAGKAHPADGPGKQLLQTVYQVATRIRSLLVTSRWLRMMTCMSPVTSSRASTSGSTHLSHRWKPAGPVGKKRPSNWCPNLSVLDGWWAEGYGETNGWAIGTPGGRVLGCGGTR